LTYQQGVGMGHPGCHGIRIYPMTAGSQIHLVTTL